MDIFCPGSGGKKPKIFDKKRKVGKGTKELETERENTEKPIFQSHFELAYHYSNNILATYSDFVITECECTIAVTADVSFKTALAVEFNKENKNIEFLWKHRPGVGLVIALPPVASQIPGKYLCF